MDTTATLSKNSLSNLLMRSNQNDSESAISLTATTLQDSSNQSKLIATNSDGPNISTGSDNNVSQDSTSSTHHETSLDAELKNDSSSLSMAFTISLEDESTCSSKKLGIKDSIRRFAPPKPNTIERPRPSKGDSANDTDYSQGNFESLPADLTQHSPGFSRQNNSPYRSSCRRSNSSKQSNVSESAAFLIDRMLNCKQQSENTSNDRASVSSKSSSKSHPHQRPRNQSRSNFQAKSSDDILDREIDFSEDKSDNGTYIVGTDPESEAARKKIDELFGVLKAAEASVIADCKQGRESSRTYARQSRLPERKPLSRERQERINQLAKNSSRSSSSSRNENVKPTNPHHQPRRGSSSRHSHYSCDRSTKIHDGSRSRRSASQSSRHSSNREHSDLDTRSSQSSLRMNDEVDVNSQDNVNILNPATNMKYNRAFALRRARLGLGEPLSSHIPVQENEHPSGLALKSQMRNQNYNSKPGSSGTFSRADGGRFSLRTKSNLLQRFLPANSRLVSSQNKSNFDNYASRIPSSKVMGITSGATMSQPDSPLRNTPKNMHQSTPQSNVTYQSGDELEAIRPSRHKFQYRSSRLPTARAHQTAASVSSDVDFGEVDRAHAKQHFNCPSTNNDQDINYYGLNESRTGSNILKQGSSQHLNALDSLVISAVTTLSSKIRSSVCELLMDSAKKLPIDNEIRLIVEEILPQLTDHSVTAKSPPSIEEIDQSLYFDLAKTLKNLKKVEQMVEVISLISNQFPNQSASILSNTTALANESNVTSNLTQTISTGVASTTAESNTSTNSQENSPLNDLSPV